MSKETLVFIIGALVFFTPFLGLPGEYKEWIFIFSGLILLISGYRLRRAAFLRSIERAGGERQSESFHESTVTEIPDISTHKDTKGAL